jgi:MFS family permease
MPTRQAFLFDLVSDRAHLPNVIALNSSMVNLTRLVGPLLGGLLIAAGGPKACFVVDAISYVAVIVALAAMRDLPHYPPKTHGAVIEGLMEGLHYGLGFPPIRALLLLVGVMSLLGMPLATLLPVFAKNILGGGERLYGVLAACSGVGAFGAALYLASLTTVVGLGRKIAWSGIWFGGGLIAFSFSRSVPLSLAILVVTGFAMMLLLAGCNTLLQTIVEDDKRGRVMSLYAMAFMGTVPLGSLLSGSLASRFGAPLAAGLCGAGCVAGSLYFGWRLPSIRRHVVPIYVKAGILPPVTAAVQTTAELRTPPEEPT